MGRGPTRLMVPTNTFQTWGSSSRLYLRRKLPIEVTRGSRRSFREAYHSARASGCVLRYSSKTSVELTHIVRNFHMEKNDPFLRIRRWEKKTGPGEVHIMIAEMMAKSGSRTGKESNTRDTSRMRLTAQ